MISGKAGLLYCHMGDGSQGLQPLKDAVALGSIPITQILPTHMSRNQQLIDEGEKWVGEGGWVDVTAEDNVRAFAWSDVEAHRPQLLCRCIHSFAQMLTIWDVWRQHMLAAHIACELSA